MNNFPGDLSDHSPKAKTLALMQVETCTSMALVPKYWNVNTGVFLRRYTYNRIGSGFFALAATQIICSIWHGPSEGYLAFFAGSVVLFHSTKGAPGPMNEVS